MTINAAITPATMNLLAVISAATAYAAKPNPDYDKTTFVLNDLEVKPGVVNVSFKIPGRTMHKSLTLPGYKSDMTGQGASSPVKLVTGFVKELVGKAASIARRG